MTADNKLSGVSQLPGLCRSRSFLCDPEWSTCTCTIVGRCLQLKQHQLPDRVVTASRSRFSFNVRHFIVRHFQPFVNICHYYLIHHYDINRTPPDVTCTYYILHLCCQNQPNTLSISEQSDALFYLMVCEGFSSRLQVFSWAFCEARFSYLSSCSIVQIFI